MKKLLITITVIILLLFSFFCGRYSTSNLTSPEVVCTYPDLSSWQILELAIMKTESDFNSLAVGTHQDCGIFQIVPVYVQEVNRILDTTRYEHSDAFDVGKSVEMFNIYQSKHNSDHDIARAIRIHNPGGDSIGYSRKVMENYRYIASMETARREVIRRNSYARHN